VGAEGSAPLGVLS